MDEPERQPIPGRQPTQDGPAHPTMAAALLMIGVVLLLVLIAVVSAL